MLVDRSIDFYTHYKKYCDSKNKTEQRKLLDDMNLPPINEMSEETSWTEYMYGLDGRPPLKLLDETFPKKWRGKNINDRLNISRVLENEETAAERERVMKRMLRDRTRDGVSMNQFSRQLVVKGYKEGATDAQEEVNEDRQ